MKIKVEALVSLTWLLWALRSFRSFTLHYTTLKTAALQYSQPTYLRILITIESIRSSSLLIYSRRQVKYMSSSPIDLFPTLHHVFGMISPLNSANFKFCLPSSLPVSHCYLPLVSLSPMSIAVTRASFRISQWANGFV